MTPDRAAADNIHVSAARDLTERGFAPPHMERLLKWLDDWDDLWALARVQAGPIMVTLVLLVAFVAIVGAVFLLGPPDLHAAP